jgi:carbon storage regulator
MLVLTRKFGEKIVIDYHGMLTTIVIAGVEGGKVRLGIEAPASVLVDRQEVHERRIAQQRVEHAFG